MNNSSSSDSDWEEDLNEMAVEMFFLNGSKRNRKLLVHPVKVEGNQKISFNLFIQLKYYQ